jgi:hypothetical protein
MISIPSAYSSRISQRFPATDQDSSGIAAGENLRPIENDGTQQDTVTLSGQGRELSAQHPAAMHKPLEKTSPNSQATGAQKDQAQQAHDLEIIQQLKKRDTDVRTHEMAHLAVAGRYAAGSVSHSYQTGPDGVKYAIGGEVPIDMSSESTPEATIQKMETVRRAALAPADPSAADLQIASAASAKEIQAMQELQVIQRDKATLHHSTTGTGTSSVQQVKGTANTSLPSQSTPFSVGSGSISPGNSRKMMIQTYQVMMSIA